MGQQRLLVLVAITATVAGCDYLRAGHRREMQRVLTSQHSAGAGEVAPPARRIAPEAEELWIIASDTVPGPSAIDTPQLPYLRAVEPGTDSDMLPLVRTEVRASVSGPVATVGIAQRYRNPFGRSIDLEYVFPLPATAAVSDFIMTIGSRHIRGIVRTRAEAQQIYAEASRAGRIASLLTQEAANNFQERIANLPAGQPIDVETTYFDTLRFDGGDYELLLPGAPLAALPRGADPDEGPRFDVAVDIDAGMEIGAVRSPSHTIAVQGIGTDHAHVELQGGSSLAHDDFVLRYRTAGKDLRSGFLAHRDQRGGFFLLIMQPPEDRHRALTDVEVDWGGLAVSDVHPQAIPDLSAEPVVLTGRFRNQAPTAIHITGHSGTASRRYTVDVGAIDLEEDHPALVSLWARAHIAALERDHRRSEEIADFALEYGIVSAHSGILAVEAGASPGARQPQADEGRNR